jgi:hypothetical protein
MMGNYFPKAFIKAREAKIHNESIKKDKPLGAGACLSKGGG